MGRTQCFVCQGKWKNVPGNGEWSGRSAKSIISENAVLCIENSFTRSRPLYVLTRSKDWRSKNWILHQALLTCRFLIRNSKISLSHPTYSLDLALADFHIFPKIKSSSKVSVLTSLLKSRANRCKYSTRSRKMTSRPNSKSGRNVGTCVLLCKIGIPNEVMLNLRCIKCLFKMTNSGTFFNTTP